MKISIIGIGRLGGALAVALSRKGFEIENLVVRERKENARAAANLIEPKPRILNSTELSKISSEAIFIATQDAAIESVAENLAAQIKNKPFVFHASGALSSEILGKLKDKGCRTASIHPLVSVSDAVLGAERFANAFFCVEGDAKAVREAKKIVEALGGKSFSIETKYKTLYHAAAVTASGHLIALVDAALEMLGKCDLKEQEARRILLPLIRSTVENLETQTTARALTGTFARADKDALGRQLKVLDETVSPEVLEVFLQLGLRSLHLAERQNANVKNIEKMRDAIRLAKKNLKC